MEASMRVILSSRVACEAAKETVVAKNVRTVSMRARMSLAKKVMYCGCYMEVLRPAILDRMVGMGTKSMERRRASGPAVLKLELLEEWPVELKRMEGILVKLWLEAP